MLTLSFSLEKAVGLIRWKNIKGDNKNSVFRLDFFFVIACSAWLTFYLEAWIIFNIWRLRLNLIWRSHSFFWALNVPLSWNEYTCQTAKNWDKNKHKVHSSVRRFFYGDWIKMTEYGIRTWSFLQFAYQSLYLLSFDFVSSSSKARVLHVINFTSYSCLVGNVHVCLYSSKIFVYQR